MTGSCTRAAFASVEMSTTASTAKLPSVTGVDGLKDAPSTRRSPEVQVRVTIPLKEVAHRQYAERVRTTEA